MLRQFLLTLILSAFAQSTWAQDTVTITRFHEAGIGSVNTWIIEDSENIVLIDAQRTLRAGEQLAQTLQETGKNLRAVLITHPHPDHIGGIPSIAAEFPDAQILAIQSVNEELRSDSLGIMAFARRVNGDAFPAETPFASELVKDGDILRYGDIELRVQDIGAGESIAMTVFFIPESNALFVGDLVDNDMHGFVFEQRSSQWLVSLDEVRLDYASNPIAYPGHGASAPLFDLIDAQGKWLRDMRDIVNERIADGEFSDQDVEESWAEFQRRHPNQLPVAPIDGLGPLNLRAVAAELAGRK
ncbi:MBL fold metallo-hydrolase [Roseobacter ponti]|uniref:MBL fold metallo-hydrolase n=1 Tax=Roseobacter ponti TaxID=1891787 RepID=A0A858SV35_9RHOB|nr:MBL fold metallo-hydrolase [Roseobacter ponti]QJF52584.1 MBL fold metallo-hydrolase [Roseobacter ponti]